jgi:hypothetical protein
VEENIMTLSIKIIDSIRAIEKNVNKAIADHMNSVMNRKQGEILSEVKTLIPIWIHRQPEISALLSTDPAYSLKGQFGIPGETMSIVNTIIQAVVDATVIKIVKFSPNLKGGLELQFQPSNFSNLLSLPQGHTIYNGGDLHWLDWLLKRGDNIIVTNYQYSPESGIGRSGLGHMVGGGSFRVPPQFSGTETDNFITRAFIGPQQEIDLAYSFKKILR